MNLSRLSLLGRSTREPQPDSGQDAVDPHARYWPFFVLFCGSRPHPFWAIIWGQVIARVSRLCAWEFWPTWLFYLPILPWLAWLSLRYRGVLIWTAANPGIPQGGVVGESKHGILAQLPQWAVVPTLLVPPGVVGLRLAQVQQACSGLVVPADSQAGRWPCRAGVKLAAAIWWTWRNTFEHSPARSLCSAVSSRPI